MARIIKLNIAYKLPLAVIGAALFASLAIGIGSYLVSASTVTSLTEDKLQLVAQARARQLQTYFDSISDDLVVTASAQATVTTMGELGMNWKMMVDNQTSRLQDTYIAGNPHKADQRELMDSSGPMTTRTRNTTPLSSISGSPAAMATST
jgi:hypothetical protein